jgi:hypothetical protein
MNAKLKGIINNYYSELQQAFKTGTIHFEKLHLDDHVKVIAPTERFEGKETVQEMFKQLITVVDHFDIQRQYYDNESCCTVMDCVTKFPPYHIATIEWILVADNKVTEIHPVYDTLAWQELIQNIS